jgi:protein-tyrosine-phosphatase
MATRKASVPKDEQLEKQDFPLFDAIAALDKKDYDYYDRLTPEQQRKFVPFMLIKWLSYVKGSSDVAGYYAMSTEYYANKYFFNEYVSKHPKLQWYMMCAASPGKGKQYHQWLPQIKERVSLLKEPAQVKEIKEYFTKIYPKANSEDLTEYSKAFVQEQRKKMHLAEIYPHLKIADIEVLSQTVTDEDITQYEKDRGN